MRMKLQHYQPFPLLNIFCCGGCGGAGSKGWSDGAPLNLLLALIWGFKLQAMRNGWSVFGGGVYWWLYGTNDKGCGDWGGLVSRMLVALCTTAAPTPHSLVDMRTTWNVASLTFWWITFSYSGGPFPYNLTLCLWAVSRNTGLTLHPVTRNFTPAAK